MAASNPYAPPQAVVHDVVDLTQTVTLANRGARFVANLLDSVILGAIVYVPMLLAAAAAGALTAQRDQTIDETPFLVLALALACAGVGVWLWLTIRYLQRNGQSLGKKLLGIKVVRSDGSRASVSRIIWLRNVVNGLIGLVPLYGVIDALFIFNEPRQCLHDKLADTIVIDA